MWIGKLWLNFPLICNIVARLLTVLFALPSHARQQCTDPCNTHAPTNALPSLPVMKYPNPTPPPNLGTLGLHYAAADALKKKYICFTKQRQPRLVIFVCFLVVAKITCITSLRYLSFTCNALIACYIISDGLNSLYRQILWHHLWGCVDFFFKLNLLPPYLLRS